MGLQSLKLRNFTTKPKLKFKLKKYVNTAGKNNSGQITVHSKSAGHKKRYRQINFTSNKNFLGIVFSIEYDPNRNSNIASIFNFKSNNFFYVIAANNLLIGNIVKSGFYAENKNGHTMILRKIPIGCCIYNITFKFSNLGKISRSAGTYSVVLEKTHKYATILLSSGKKKKLPLNCSATIGIVSKDYVFLIELGKAGKSRWLNKKPNVRGVAKNPVDHPNGGGEGKKSGKRKTPWGKSMNSYKK
jgi:large subunit ribosomal protein L2